MDGSDDTIAPVSNDNPLAGASSNTIANYRAYLEANTGGRQGAAPQTGAGPAIAPVDDSQDGAGPSIAPAPPQAVRGLSVAPASNDPEDQNVIAPVGQAPQAPQADEAPRAKKAAKMKGARQAAQAPQAPTIDPGTPQPNGGPQIAPDPTAQPSFGPNAAPVPMGTAGTEAGAQQPAPSTDLGDASAMTPASGHVVKGKTTPDGKPVISVKPPDHDASDFDSDKLKNAHTIADVFDALPENKQSTYMDWWQQQHGDINKRYDQMRQELGARPDPNRDPTRKEKFTELMNFGLSLMQHAQRGTDQVAAAGGAMQSALQTQKDKQVAQTQDYDTRVANIENQRQNQLKDMGNYGQAMREDALIQNENTRTKLAEIAALKPPKANQPTTRILNDGTQVEYDPEGDDGKGGKGAWKPSVQTGGKPLGKMPLQGPKGGLSKAGMGRTAELDDLINNKHLDPNEALNRVFPNAGARQLDPTKTYNQIYAASRRAGEDTDGAATEAERITELMHGPNWQQSVTSRGKPAITPKPPAVAPPPGKIGVTPDGSRWRRGANGQPELVPQ